MDAARFDAVARAIAARVPRRTVLRALVAGVLSSTTAIRSARAQAEFDFKPLMLPFPPGSGYLKNGGPDTNRHFGSDSNAVDVCQCTATTWSSIGDPVLAPTDFTFAFTDRASRNNVEADALDFHFFEVASSSDKRLCMSFAHFALATAPETRDGRGYYPQGSTVGTVLDYRDGNSSIPHIHMGLHTVPVSSTCGTRAGRITVGFDGDYALDGVPYAVGNRYIGPVVSHNASGTIKPGGVWSELTLVGDTLMLQARAYPSNAGDPPIERVEFTLWWPELGARQGPWTLACEDTTASNGDNYSCTANLGNLGVPPGDLDVSFDVYDTNGNYQLAPNGVRTVDYSDMSVGSGCPADQTRCGSACVDTGSNWWHCGTCDQMCGIFQICCDGRCGCDPTVIVPFWCAFAEYICPAH